MEKSADQGAMWYPVENVNEINSPSLLVYPERIEYNIARMIGIAGRKERLWPHVKTHKMPELIRMQIGYGITKFKCATIAEAEMTARCGPSEILLAIQPVGPNQKRLMRLKKEFPSIKFSCIVDCLDAAIGLSGLVKEENSELSVWLDINCGMNRTGLEPGKEAAELYRKIQNLPSLRTEGLHVYDGHIHEPDLAARRKICESAFRSVDLMVRDHLDQRSGKIRIIAGGTPTFPLHALRNDVDLSPGTFILWDYGYSSSFTDLDFMHAAVLLTRVISKPGGDVICLDLGHKAVGSEMAHPRVRILGLESSTVVTHNEEHLAITTPEAGRFKVGDPVYCIPRHICSTVDRHDYVNVVRNGRVTGEWLVEARKRRITI